MWHHARENSEPEEIVLCDCHCDHSLQVLDMCAAPGSKTAQLIEALHADDTEASTMPSMSKCVYA